MVSKANPNITPDGAMFPMPLLEFVPGPPICALEGVFFVLTLCVGMPGVARGRNQIEKAIAVRFGYFCPEGAAYVRPSVAGEARYPG